MPDLIDSAQLHATAQVAKSFILEQDTANVNTIINALQQGGGATPATAKLEPTLTISRTFNYSGTYPSWSYEYNGDGEIFGYADSSSYQSNDPRFLKIDRTAKRIYLHNDTDPAVCYKIMLYATEGELYAAKYAEQEDME